MFFFCIFICIRIIITYRVFLVNFDEIFKRHCFFLYFFISGRIEQGDVIGLTSAIYFTTHVFLSNQYLQSLDYGILLVVDILFFSAITVQISKHWAAKRQPLKRSHWLIKNLSRRQSVNHISDHVFKCFMWCLILFFDLYWQVRMCLCCEISLRLCVISE